MNVLQMISLNHIFIMSNPHKSSWSMKKRWPDVKQQKQTNYIKYKHYKISLWAASINDKSALYHVTDCAPAEGAEKKTVLECMCVWHTEGEKKNKTQSFRRTKQSTMTQNHGNQKQWMEKRENKPLNIRKKTSEPCQTQRSLHCDQTHWEMIVIMSPL